jgi:hypothetical protein
MITLWYLARKGFPSTLTAGIIWIDPGWPSAGAIKDTFRVIFPGIDENGYLPVN